MFTRNEIDIVREWILVSTGNISKNLSMAAAMAFGMFNVYFRWYDHLTYKHSMILQAVVEPPPEYISLIKKARKSTKDFLATTNKVEEFEGKRYIMLFRGVSGRYEPGLVRTIESWTESFEMAKNFAYGGGVVIHAMVPVENVIFHHRDPNMVSMFHDPDNTYGDGEYEVLIVNPTHNHEVDIVTLWVENIR